MKKYLLVLLMVVVGFFFMSRNSALSVQTMVNGNPQKALIMLHGYGQSGAKMQHLAEQLKPLFPNTIFYFPNAPERAPYRGYQWFSLPILNIENITEKDYQNMMSGALESVELVEDMIEEIHKKQNIAYENISVAGFSQGGMMAVLTGLLSPNRLPKVVSLSGVPIIFTEDFKADMVSNKPQILLVQGTNDRVVPPESLNMSQKTLQQLGITPQLVEMRGLGHQIDGAVLQKMADFLQ